MIILGFDIGGTKSAVILANELGNHISFLDRSEIQTTKDWKANINELINKGQEMLDALNLMHKDYKIGISCGGPLDSNSGIILSPPNLPGWENVPIVDYIYSRLGVKATLQNDADACALAEWKYGAGKGYQNIIFLTFGTGLGAGLILNGQLYKGASNMAGEVGHIRLEEIGPVGYGKYGSFEGFCSGGGIAQIAKERAYVLKTQGIKASYIKNDIEDITAKDIAEAAQEGNDDALTIFNISGRYLGKGLSILIDILNPEVIIIGSIYARAGNLLKDAMYEEIQKEALEQSRKIVKIIPAQLGEQIGDYGAIVTALV